jgi:cellulose synthase/poly-beta-1,6-N-acetylglucosamine synthase-like glycosyltransferase
VRAEAFERRLEDARAFGRACNALAKSRPDLSAKEGVTAGQAAGLWAIAGVLAAFFILRPHTATTLGTLLLAGMFALIILFRIAAAVSAFIAGPAKAALPTCVDADLPVLTILVPLYDEGADVVASLVEALRKLNYPPDRLDVKLLLEADDDDTIEAVRHSDIPSWFELIPVPPGEPRTKPKALNLGLASARGEIIAVFDAEDRPSPDQPREAVAAFRSGSKNLAVVQAPLLAHNGADGWFARQFQIEYAILFRVWLPFLARAGLPLPLGGTSNYFCRRKLEAAGGWDAWNVTEDADLGFRLARFGGRAGTISLPTWEEAPVRGRDWLKQRTRWMKGHLQTWLVLMRQPFRAANEMGWVRFASVQLTLAGSLLASLMHLPILLWMSLGWASGLVSLEGWHAAIFGVGYGSVIAAAWASREKGLSPIGLLTSPLYWPLLSIAMIRALLEIRRRPHFWAKTPHGAQTRR